jgi:hypothetical protein
MLHRVYGLVLESDVPLPELPTGEGPVDLSFSLDPGPLAPADPRWFRRSEWLSCARTERGTLVRVPDLADFLVDVEGRSIRAAPLRGTSDDMVRHLLLDQVLPLVLELRGLLALHATAVRTEQGACAFLGETGSGKSTLAASFLAHGHEVVCDDCLRVTVASSVLAIPGYPGLRLHEKSAPLLGAIAPEPYGSKWRFVPSTPFARGPLPLVRIYALERNARASIESIAPAMAFMKLVAAAYRLDPTDRRSLERQHDMLSRLLSLVTLRRLSVPEGIERVAEARAAVLSDLAST